MSGGRVQAPAGALLLVCAIAASPAVARADAGPRDAGPAALTDGGPITFTRPLEEPSVRVGASADRVTLGRPFSVFVTVTRPRGMQVNLPASLGLGTAFEEIRRTNEARVRPDGTSVREFELSVMAWNVGDLEIPPIPVTYAVQGRVGTVHGNPVPIRVISFIGEGEESLRDIAPPVPVYERDWTPIYVAGAVAAILVGGLLVLLGRRALRRRRHARGAGAAAVTRAPDAEALARLRELEDSGALDTDDYQPVYVALSEIVRAYLGSRYGFRALDSTSSELLERLRELPEAEPAIEPVRELVGRFDLVKYARGETAADQARADLERVRQIVLTTRPPVVGGADA